MNIHRSIGMFLAGTCIVALAGPAFAQANSASANAQPAQGQTDQNAIIVTAQKRAQVLIDVPQSITVVGGATLEQQHANNFQDYLKLVPGLGLDQSRPGEGRLILRGVNTEGVASTVGVYVDETPFGSSSGLVNGAVLAGDFDTFDLSQSKFCAARRALFTEQARSAACFASLPTRPRPLGSSFERGQASKR